MQLVAVCTGLSALFSLQTEKHMGRGKRRRWVHGWNRPWTKTEEEVPGSLRSLRKAARLKMRRKELVWPSTFSGLPPLGFS